jgi:hypothetical protein
LNTATKKYPYPLTFTNEVLDKVVGHEVYSFSDSFFGYHQIQITPKDCYKTTFITDWGRFVWVVMPFGFKNAPPTHQRTMSKAFKDYLDDFMKLFLDDSWSLVIWIHLYPNYKSVSKSVGSMG